MDCCSSTGAAQIAPEFSLQINQSADQLAALLAQAPEYQEFTRLARLINLDPDVRRLSMEIRNRQRLYIDPEDVAVEALQTELESLPAVVTFRKAEAEVKSSVSFDRPGDQCRRSRGICPERSQKWLWLRGIITGQV